MLFAPKSDGQCHRMRSETFLLYVPEFLKDCAYRLQHNKMYMKLAAFSGLGVFLVRYGDFSVSLAGLGVLGAYVATGGWRYIWVICNTFGRDLWSVSPYFHFTFFLEDFVLFTRNFRPSLHLSHVSFNTFTPCLAISFFIFTVHSIS